MLSDLLKTHSIEDTFYRETAHERMGLTQRETGVQRVSVRVGRRGAPRGVVTICARVCACAWQSMTRW